VTVTNDDGRLAVEVSDDGVGGADIALGTGLRGLRDRLAAIDGQFDIDSKPGHGTTLRASIPCP
jgi:signal transduction histidine kinase